MVTEDTHVQQDNDTPRELNNAIRLIIEQFVQGESNFDAMNSAAWLTLHLVDSELQIYIYIYIYNIKYILIANSMI